MVLTSTYLVSGNGALNPRGADVMLEETASNSQTVTTTSRRGKVEIQRLTFGAGILFYGRLT